MSNLNVLISGASIAGPSAAYWFAKAGATVTVVERFPSLRTNGQNVDIRSAGVTVMRKIPGMEEAVRSKRTTMEGVAFVRKNGTPYGVAKATGNPDEQSLVSEFEIFRGDLAQVLFDLTKDNDRVKYVFGEQISAIEQDEQDGPATVTFLNGYRTTKYDLVVACDGATSRTRALGFGWGIRDHIDSTNCWAAYFTMKKDLLEGRKIAEGLTAPGGRAVMLGPDPTGTSRCVFMGFHPKNQPETCKKFREAMKAGTQDLKQFVAKHFEGIGWKAPEMIQGMLEAEDFYGSEVVQVKLPQLYKGRFVVVGDAAHAPGFTGGGTSLAMAGAYMLAGEISSHKGNIAEGLRGYDERMKPIAADLQKMPPLIREFMAPQTALGIRIRNGIFAFITHSGILHFSQRHLGGAFANPDKYNIPEYEWVA